MSYPVCDPKEVVGITLRGDAQKPEQDLNRVTVHRIASTSAFDINIILRIDNMFMDVGESLNEIYGASRWAPNLVLCDFVNTSDERDEISVVATLDPSNNRKLRTFQ